MKKFWKKESKKEKGYKIAFCDTYDLNTKFGEWKGTFDTYEAADHTIRMGWNKSIIQKIENAYQINDAWLVIEKIL